MNGDHSRERKDPLPLSRGGGATEPSREEHAQPSLRAFGDEPPVALDSGLVVPTDLRVAHQRRGSFPIMAIAAFIVFCLGGGAYAYWKFSAAESESPPAQTAISAPAATSQPGAAQAGYPVSSTAPQPAAAVTPPPVVKTPVVAPVPIKPTIDQAARERQQAADKARRAAAQAQRDRELAARERQQADKARQAAEQAQRDKDQAARKRQQADQARQAAAAQAERAKEQAAARERQQAADKARQAAEQAQRDKEQAEQLRLAAIRRHDEKLRVERQRKEAAARRAQQARAKQEQAVEEQIDQAATATPPQQPPAQSPTLTPPRREQNAKLVPRSQPGDAPPLDATDLPPRAPGSDNGLENQ